MKFPVVTLTLAAALSALSVTSLPAQSRPRRVPVPEPVSLFVIALHDLRFSSVLQGIPKSVNPHDPDHSALFEIRGLAGASVRAEFVLPAALIGDGGDLLPVDFNAGDGYADPTRGSSSLGVVFDPHAPLITTLSSGGQIFLRLGGTVRPSRPQAGGEYRTIIVITVYNLGT